MSIKGFTVDGQDYQYNYPNLDNIPEITPESIGAAPQDEVDALKSESYNLIDPTGITPYQSTSAADLTRTGFVIRNTAEATYSRGYLYLTLKPNTDYTFSAKKHTTSGVAYVGYSEAPAEGEPFPSANISLISRTAPDDETITKTFTTTTGILVIRFYATWDTAELGKVEYSEIMVIEGTEAKPFVRHVFAQDDEARNAVNDPQTGLDQKAGILRNTASGAIVSFTPDASVKDLLGLTVAVEPVQDLHGYANPWPAGGGVNLLPESVVADATVNGIRFQSFGDGTIKVSGAAGVGAVYQINLANPVTLPASDIYVHLLNPVMNVNVALSFVNGSTIVGGITLGTVNRVYKLAELSGATLSALRIVVANNETVDITFSPMLCLDDTVKPFSPYSNECPISGWTGAEVTRTGKNLNPYEGVNFTADANPAGFWLNAGDYVFSLDTGGSFGMGNSIYIKLKDRDGNVITDGNISGAGWSVNGTRQYYYGFGGNYTSAPFTLLTDCFFCFGFNNTKPTANGVQLELGSTATAYEPYAGETYPITFPTEAGTVYGGTLDVTTGKLTVDRAMVDMGALTWVKNANGTYSTFDSPSLTSVIEKDINSVNAICSCYSSTSNHDAVTSQDNRLFIDSNGRVRAKETSKSALTETEYKTYITGQTLVYKLATPIVYDLAPQQIETIKGQINNVWADVGDVTVEFAEDIKTYIDNKFAELQALALENS